ncbi:adenylyltransferase, partial [Turicibacter sanguinis]|nr:adenylyltransferase [Turicibacter sanguinis]
EKLFCIGPFANKIALEISRELNYPYSEQEVQRVTKFLHRINSLPDNATDFNR